MWVEKGLRRIATSAANGALADRKVAGLIFTSLEPVCKWLIDTPAKEISWEGFGEKLEEGIKGAVLEKVVGNYISSFAKKSKKFSKLDAESYADFDQGRTKLYGSNIKISTRSQKEIEEAYKLFSRKSPLRQDGNYLEKVMNAMAPPDKYKIKGQKLGYRYHPADKLADNVTHMTGRAIGPNEHAYHIVAGGASRESAVNALAKIKALGIDVNEGANGVFLPKSCKYVVGTTPAHAKIHTNDYYDEVWMRIENINDPMYLRGELQKIKDEIIAGSFRY